ncbi:UNVERIFIED_CONTAM: ABC transporter G family member 22 [Sesamum calycinum]|uniref:ABC transporter G family member 22 n=1 Tax=Sesamum calycinum TaxID=2727403 RepID=A0AAW2N241_9LAMI
MDQKTNSTTSLIRTKSDQLVETMAAALAAMKSPLSSGEAAASSGGLESSGNLSRKSSRRLAMASPGRSSGSVGKNTHIRKSRSAQMKFDLDDLNSGAALSRASSASLGFSFSFTGFTVPPDEIADLKPFSDDEILEDLEAGRQKKKLHSEPTLPIYLKFTDVTYKVVLKGMTSTVERDILNGITGSVDPGEVLALMGPSGSGKTTLLSILGGRVREPAPGVKETLTYSARLRLPRTLTKEEKDQRAMDVIDELGLERCQDTMIGGSFVRGVSGGERKRVCIGNEIIINPSLLFLDEPTSGLDSTTALRIVDTLHEIAEAGKTVITTIHQPSSRLFLKFDKLILLGKGSLLYYGKASEAMVYFSSIGCSPLIAMNPAEFMLDLANGNVTDISVPSELEDKVQMGDPEAETKNGKPAPAVVHEGLGLAIGATLMDLKKATTLASVTVMTFMLAGGYFVKNVPVFISWLRYLSFNYHTYKLLLKVQYEHISHSINGVRIDNGYKETPRIPIITKDEAPPRSLDVLEAIEKPASDFMALYELYLEAYEETSPLSEVQVLKSSGSEQNIKFFLIISYAMLVLGCSAKNSKEISFPHLRLQYLVYSDAFTFPRQNPKSALRSFWQKV